MTDLTPQKIAIFGNSGSGKSTLAKQFSESHQLAHFDLDDIAWRPIAETGMPPQRSPLSESQQVIDGFMTQNPKWVIEGCYADLLEFALLQCDQVIFLNLPIEQCIANAQARPWEPHKYASKAEQDKNLPMLLEWIAQYESRTDTFSQTAHQALFDGFAGEKVIHTHNQR